MPTSDLPLDKRYPLLNEAGRKMLDWLAEHPHAPRYNHFTGNRLTAEGLAQVRDFESLISAQPPTWQPGALPPWLSAFVESCFARVPFYRSYGAPPASFLDVPTFNRADLAGAPYRFVPDDLPLEDLIIYGTSGTTGHPIDIPCCPTTAAMYLPLLRAVLDLWGVKIEGGPGRVACLLICSQRDTYTLFSISPYLADAGWAKINLNPGEWPTPDSPTRFIDDCQAEFFTGDPLAFADLARLPLTTRPKALISTAMAFLPGQREALAAHFGCPVIDLYSMTEAGPIAACDPTNRGHILLQPHLYVEILDPDGAPCPPGERGEITLTGGFNPYFPLLRYRTNDYAALEFSGRQPILTGLHGRPPTLFRTVDGRWINNVDINYIIHPFHLEQFNLHQNADGSLRLRVRGVYDASALRQSLLNLFGVAQVLTIDSLTDTQLTTGKLLLYTSDLPQTDIHPG